MNSNDGTTAVQVSPIPTESEMASIRQIFTNVANALVRASELAQQVTQLESRLNLLDHDYTQVMARNDELVQSLHEVRTQREAARTELALVIVERDAADAEATANANGWNEAKHLIDDLNARLNQTSNDYNEAMNSWHKAETERDEALAALAKIKSALGIVDPPKPEPQPKPSPMEVHPAPSEPVVNPEPRPLSQEQVEPYNPPPYDYYSR